MRKFTYEKLFRVKIRLIGKMLGKGRYMNESMFKYAQVGREWRRSNSSILSNRSIDDFNWFWKLRMSMHCHWFKISFLREYSLSITLMSTLRLLMLLAWRMNKLIIFVCYIYTFDYIAHCKLQSNFNVLIKLQSDWHQCYVTVSLWRLNISRYITGNVFSNYEES